MFSYEQAWEELKRKIKTLQSSAESPQKEETCKEILKTMDNIEYHAVLRSIVRCSRNYDDD